MSTLEPSASARPLVTRGIALAIPPLPVLVPTPAPVRLNQVSSVNVAAPNPAAGPKVTYWFEPLNWSAVPASAAWAPRKGRRNDEASARISNRDNQVPLRRRVATELLMDAAFRMN